MSGVKSTKTQEQKYNFKIPRSILVILGLTCAFFSQVLADSEQDVSTLQIYLPREVTISDDNIKLGEVSIIRGEDSFVATANKIALGRISVPGQKIIVDRPTLLSRLACNGIPPSKVTLTGAEKITVKKQEQTINGSEFVELASIFLEKNHPADSVCELLPVQIPKSFVVPEASKDVRLVPRLIRNGATEFAKVQIAVTQNGKQIGVREVTFRLKYTCHKAVTLVDIPAGTVISPENVKIEESTSTYPEPADWRTPYGLITKRRLPKETTIYSNMVSPAEPTVIIKRNQNVVIRIEKPGLLVTAIGRTMQEGREGQYIKVRNIDSQRIIIARVNKDGTVEPTF